MKFSLCKVGRGRKGSVLTEYSIMIVAALLARVGLSVMAVGLVRSKHAAATAGRAVVELCFAVLAYWAVGVAFTQLQKEGWGLFSFRPEMMVGLNDWAGASSFMGLIAVVLAGGLITDTLAERVRFWPTMAAASVLGAVTVPLTILWSIPWLSHRGGGAFGNFVHRGDFYLSLPLIAVAAFALVGLRMIGGRLGKYRRDGSTALIPGHNLPLSFSGAMLAIGGLLSLAITIASVDRVVPAIGLAGVVVSCITQLKFGKPDIGLVVLGTLGAAVAIATTPMQSGAPGWMWVLLGGTAGAVVTHFAYMFELRLKLDDPSGQLSILGVGAAVGLVLGAPFASGADHWYVRVIASIIAVVVAIGWGGLTGWLTFTLLKKFTNLSAKEADVVDGLDLAEHDISAYPDFQQNTIRSFHMREA